MNFTLPSVSTGKISLSMCSYTYNNMHMVSMGVGAHVTQ